MKLIACAAACAALLAPLSAAARPMWNSSPMTPKEAERYQAIAKECADTARNIVNEEAQEGTFRGWDNEKIFRLFRERTDACTEATAQDDDILSDRYVDEDDDDDDKPDSPVYDKDLHMVPA